MKIKTSLSLGTVLLTGLLLSACSQQNSGYGSGQQAEDNSAVASTTMAKGVAHTHPANECTNSISHSHPNGGGAHKHRYSCKGNGIKSANEHKHPANKCTRSISHAHPNGKGSHKHRYSCKANGRSNADNGHFHPENSMTRSIRHAHPNGKRKHSHRYSM